VPIRPVTYRSLKIKIDPPIDNALSLVNWSDNII